MSKIVLRKSDTGVHGQVIRPWSASEVRILIGSLIGVAVFAGGAGAAPLIPGAAAVLTQIGCLGAVILSVVRLGELGPPTFTFRYEKGTLSLGTHQWTADAYTGVAVEGDSLVVSHPEGPPTRVTVAGAESETLQALLSRLDAAA